MWRALRAREHLTFGRLRLPDGVDAALVGTVVLIDDRLGLEQRAAALAHELIHEERGILPAAAPAHVVAKEERLVDDEVARRLVPLDEMLAIAERCDRLDQPCEAWELAEIFGVTEEVARRAVAMLERHGLR